MLNLSVLLWYFLLHSESEPARRSCIQKGWKTVPWTITSRSVLDVHSVQAVCDPWDVVQDRNNKGYSLQHCAVAALICTTQLQLRRIAAYQGIEGKGEQERNFFKGAQAWDICDRVILTERSHLDRRHEDWTKKTTCVKCLADICHFVFLPMTEYAIKIIPCLLSMR